MAYPRKSDVMFWATIIRSKIVNPFKIYKCININAEPNFSALQVTRSFKEKTIFMKDNSALLSTYLTIVQVSEALN